MCQNFSKLDESDGGNFLVCVIALPIIISLSLKVNVIININKNAFQ